MAPTWRQELVDVLRGLAVRRTLPLSRVPAHLDDLGAGMQPDIVERSSWWQEECVEDLQRSRGVTGSDGPGVSSRPGRRLAWT